MYECFGVAFPKRRLFARTGAERGRDPAAAALRRHLRTERVDFEPRHGWKLLVRHPDVALYGARTPDDPRDVPVTVGVVVRRGEAGWATDGFGGCQGDRVVAGLDVAPWTLAPGVVASRGSRTLSIEVMAPELCQSPIRDFDHAEVAYSPRRVSLFVFMRKVPPAPPGFGCSAIFLPNRRDIRLPHALGKRIVQDPGGYPPATIANLRRYRSARAGP